MRTAFEELAEELAFILLVTCEITLTLGTDGFYDQDNSPILLRREPETSMPVVHFGWVGVSAKCEGEKRQSADHALENTDLYLHVV